MNINFNSCYGFYNPYNQRNNSNVTFEKGKKFKGGNKVLQDTADAIKFDHSNTNDEEAFRALKPKHQKEVLKKIKNNK